MADEQSVGIYIDGAFYTSDDLTFKEQHEMTRLVSQLNEDIEGFDPMTDATEGDVTATVVYLVRRRTNPDYSMDDAMSLMPKDLRPPVNEQAQKRPTKAAARSK